MTTSMRQTVIAATIAVPLAACTGAARVAEPPVIVPMDAADWTVVPNTPWVGNDYGAAQFAAYEGMPGGTMTLRGVVAAAHTASFSDGTIEFDIKPLAYDDTGIIFRRQGDADGEFVYIRANPDCPAADDCIQYVPIERGRMPWNLYAADEGAAPINPTGWNHLRIVVAGRRMAVFVNRAPEPSLVVANLQGKSSTGGIGFKGPAIYANLMLHPGRGTLAGVREAVPAVGTITRLEVSSPTPLAAGAVPEAADIPAAGTWLPITAQTNGLVDLDGLFSEDHLAAAWLRTIITSPRPRRRVLHLGFETQATVFLNGERVFTGDNPYRPVEHRLSPNGRLEPDNAVIPLSLHAGENTIMVALGNAWRLVDGSLAPTPYGWGAEMHID